MIRIHFTAADFARVRFAARPAPLQELNAAFMTMFRPAPRPGGDLLTGRWRQRALRSLPPAVAPLADLVPAAARPPVFLDVFATGLTDALDAVAGTRPALLRAELERVHAHRTAPAPPWVRALHQGDAAARRLLRHAQRSAFDAVLAPVWDVVEDLHRAEFTRHALTAAEHGTGAALDGLLPGARLDGAVWECEGPGERVVALGGRGLELRPTFHWTGPPLLAEPPGHPPVLTYPAGSGPPPAPQGGTGTADALAGVIGRTRLEALLVLAEEHTTRGLARRLRVSEATASAHTAALRAAGLVASERAGRSVLHRRTALGGLLVRGRAGEGSVPSSP
ncbi:ArsR/SmtB family transcription factor [Streptomyces lavendulocolor]|uniref:ArsR/SmtB family transcription factor n=1 Tax=Streptomyces lavendulocolor TaxID=67316 RepID=UPI003C304315